MLELFGLAVLILLALIWNSLGKVSAGIALQTRTINAYLDRMEERLEVIGTRMREHFETDEERQDRARLEP